MKFDRRLALNFDWPLLFLTILIASIGIINLYSASSAGKELSGTPIYLKQIYWVAIGMFLMIICFSVDSRTFERFAFPLFMLTVILLILTVPFGKSVSGSRRWLQLGVISLQPSELLKITLILTLAKYLKKYRAQKLGITRSLIVPIFMLAMPTVLILQQPDLGTALIVLLIFFSLLIFNGIRMRTFLVMISVFLAGFPLFWHYLRDYQKMRILTFINPNLDPLDSGYHLIQSKIAVGSGVFWGKGFLRGTQNQLHFLPEQKTDFVFSVLAEEWGFVGAFIVVGLYLLLIILSLRVAGSVKEEFGAFVSVGIVSMLFWHILINIGMSIGIIPVVGVPLPFMSYGGSSTITFFIGIGLLMNISMRRFLF
ncbi:MAG: rod shape-determining protein RodA [Pseudomonadota bacterium]